MTECVDGVGVVEIGEGERRLELQLRPLTDKESTNLWSELADIGRRVAPAYHYQRAKPHLDLMGPADRAVAVRELLAADMDNGSLIARAWETAEGVAHELWVRCRAQHQDVTLPALRAIVNATNRAEVFARVRAIVESEPSATSPPTNS